MGTLVLTYGVCVSIYLHPIEDKIKNHAVNFLISCFYYFALSISAPFSGGHINPAVTLCLNVTDKHNKSKIYLIGQICGSLFGGLLGKTISLFSLFVFRGQSSFI
jgi:glycerol uptake facilitator-like aquaporin